MVGPTESILTQSPNDLSLDTQVSSLRFLSPFLCWIWKYREERREKRSLDVVRLWQRGETDRQIDTQTEKRDREIHRHRHRHRHREKEKSLKER